VEHSKIKNIIIIILLIVNIFFLALFLIGRIETGKLEKKTKEDAIRILESYGISLDMAVIPAYYDLGSYETLRDTDSERLIAESVLGKCEMDDLGGNIYQYNSSLGKAVFRGNGEFSIEIEAGAPVSDTSAAALGAYLNKLNIPVDLNSTEEEYIDGSLSSTRFTVVFDGVRIFNCRITMSFSGGNLMSISGRRLTSAPSASRSEPMIGVYTAIISFLQGVRETNLICNEITDISSGYTLSASVSGSGGLTPYWCVSTDVGKYYVNGLTGDMSTSPN